MVYGVGSPYNSDELGQSIEMCTDTCIWSSDGGCDDGGPGNQWVAELTAANPTRAVEAHWCGYGTDCTDCGPRGGFTIKAHGHDDFSTKNHGHGNHDHHDYNGHSTGSTWVGPGRRLNEDLKSTVVNDQAIGDLMDAVKSLKAQIEEMQKAELARELARELATKAELAALKDEIEEMKKDGLTTAAMK